MEGRLPSLLRWFFGGTVARIEVDKAPNISLGVTASRWQEGALLAVTVAAWLAAKEGNALSISALEPAGQSSLRAWLGPLALCKSSC